MMCDKVNYKKKFFSKVYIIAIVDLLLLYITLVYKAAINKMCSR